MPDVNTMIAGGEGGICEYFQRLPAHTRLDFMVELLELLLPFEIRLIGSVVEELGRKDSLPMRE